MNPLLVIEPSASTAVVPLAPDVSPVAPGTELAQDAVPFAVFFAISDAPPTVAMPVVLPQGGPLETPLVPDDAGEHVPVILDTPDAIQKGGLADVALALVSRGQPPGSAVVGHEAFVSERVLPPGLSKRPIQAARPDAVDNALQQPRAVPNLPSAAQRLIEGRITTHSVTPATPATPATPVKALETTKAALLQTTAATEFSKPVGPNPQIMGAASQAIPAVLPGTVPDFDQSLKDRRPTANEAAVVHPKRPIAPETAVNTLTSSQTTTSSPNLSASLKDVAQDGAIGRVLDADIVPGLASHERAFVAATASSGFPQMTAETARHAVQQIAATVAQGTGKSTEIALNPEELGRVRLTLSVADGTLALNVLADRPETQELLRRHIDVLAQEFRALGYDNLSFSFGADGQQADNGDGQEGPREDVEVAAVAGSSAVEEEARHLPPGVDLRL